jgi:hypothetical protein
MQSARCWLRSLALACVVLTAPSVIRAQRDVIPVKAGVTLEHDTVTVGEVVRLTLRIRAPKGATISFPSAVDSLGPVQALEAPVVRDGSDSASAADRIAEYRLAAWDIGRQPIKLGDALVQTDAGDRRLALALPSLFVKSVLPADTALRIPKPARPLIGVPAPFPWWWWLVALAVLALLLGIWWWLRRRRRRAQNVGDPFAEAMAAFERIEKLRLLDAGEPGRHAALMTDVLRGYLSARITGVSLALTSRELLDVVRAAPTVSIESLRSLLDAIDPIKFARAPLDAARARALGDAAKTLVREEHRRAEDLAAAAAAASKQERAA